MSIEINFPDVTEPDPIAGCGPLITPLSESLRPIKQQIFERVRAAGQISRIDVARALNVSPATVTTLTSELIDEGILVENSASREPRDPGRGRPPVSLSVNKNAYFVAGLKLSDHDLTGVIADFSGGIVASADHAFRSEVLDVAEFLDHCSALIAKLTKSAGMKITDLATIGIGIPGFVDGASGDVIWSPYLAERNINLARAARSVFGQTVVIENDANLVTLAELWFGAGREIADFAVVTIEHGVGMGFVTQHRLFRGSRGLGMELGHTKVQLDGALCRCGQRGCLEAYVANYALAREAATALNLHPDQSRTTPILLERLYAEAQAGNAAARTIFERAGRYLAAGLANITNLFDPSLIILAGERMRYDYLYADKALAEISNFTLMTGRELPPIRVHRWGDLLWAHGAAALALSAVCEERFAPRRDVEN